MTAIGSGKKYKQRCDFKLLELLMNNANRVMEKEQLQIKKLLQLRLKKYLII